MWRASRVLSAFLSAAGAVTAAYGVFELTCDGRCGPRLVQTGLPSSTLLMLGIAAVLLGLGAGAQFLFAALALHGAAILAAAGQLPPPERTGSLLLGGGVFALGTLSFAIAVKQAALARRLFNAGQAAVGTVTAIRNRTVVAVWIRPRDGSPGFAAEKTMSSYLAKKLHVGKQVAVLIDPAERGRFGIILPGQRDLPRQWQELATYVDGLPDAQPPSEMTGLPPEKPRPWVVKTVVGWLAAALVGFAAYDTFLAAGCPTNEGLCRPHTHWMVTLFGGAVLVAMVARAIGGRFVIFAMLMSVGTAAILADRQLPAWQSPDWGLTLVIATLATTGLGAIIWVVARREERLRERGVVAVGTVRQIEGERITLDIVPQDHSKGAITVVKQLSFPEPPFIGQELPVLADPDRPSRFVAFTGKLGETLPARLSTLANEVAARNAERRNALQIPAQADPLDRLEKLNDLRLAGALTEDEFRAQKAKILGTESD